jgi:MFS family permease
MIDKVRTEKIKRGDKISPLVLLTLCLTAVTLSTPLNGLSPGMSVIAKEFGFTEKQRDHYLGGYISLVTMIGQIIGSCLSGSLNFWLSRKTILELCLLIGSLSMLITSFSPNFVVLVFPRIFLGCCQGAVIPPLFSLVGDFYSPDERAVISAILSSCLGGGMMIGQLFCGFMLNWIGWRAPFAILSACSGCTISLVHYLVREPAVGSAEEDLHEVFQKGLKLPQLSIPTFLESLAIPTVLIMILQTIPNTIPWGVLSSHLHDFLATDEKLGMQEATSLIGIFGIGAAFGGLSGGCIGGRVYIANRALLPIFMVFLVHLNVRCI